MKKVFKWIGTVLAVLVGLLVVVAVLLNIMGGSRLNKTHDDVQAESITIPNDAATLARGEHLVNVGCKSCHGPDLGGLPLLADPAIGLVYAANISGVGATHSDEELVLAIRHGLDQDGRQLVIMPAESFIKLSAEDLGAIIAYLKTVPRVENSLPGPELSFMGKILLASGMMGQVFPAEYIDHDQPFPAMPEVGANIEYGAYVAGLCAGCHGPKLAGGPSGEPGAPPVPSLRGDSALQSWSEEEFLLFMRAGLTPDGRQIDPEVMPWESFGKFDDEELQGMWLYLQSLPPAG
jgi:mono/diheme cytochrome c family protein